MKLLNDYNADLADIFCTHRQGKCYGRQNKTDKIIIN